MNNIELLGLMASAVTTLSFIPQVWATFKTKDVSGISLPTYLIFTMGILLWLGYGIFKSDLPLILTNSVMAVLTGAIAFMKIFYERRSPRRLG